MNPPRVSGFEGNAECCRWSKFTAGPCKRHRGPSTYRNIHGQTVATSTVNELEVTARLSMLRFPLPLTAGHRLATVNLSSDNRRKRYSETLDARSTAVRSDILELGAKCASRLLSTGIKQLFL